jgi:hypothetical protein
MSKAFGAYVIYILFKYRRSALGVTPRSDLPGPWCVPLLGNIVQIFMPRNELLQRQTMNHEKFGPIYAMMIPGVGRVINVSDPEMVDHVLRVNFWAYEKGDFVRTSLEPLVGGGKVTRIHTHARTHTPLLLFPLTVKTALSFKTRGD